MRQQRGSSGRANATDQTKDGCLSSSPSIRNESFTGSRPETWRPKLSTSSPHTTMLVIRSCTSSILSIQAWAHRMGIAALSITQNVLHQANLLLNSSEAFSEASTKCPFFVFPFHVLDIRCPRVSTRDARGIWRRLSRNRGNHAQTGGLCCDCRRETSCGQGCPNSCQKAVSAGKA